MGGLLSGEYLFYNKLTPPMKELMILIELAPE